MRIEQITGSRKIVEESQKKLSTGSTVLNLAISGETGHAIGSGMYLWACGDSTSGKTFQMLTILAEAANNPEFDNYDLIFDDAENGALMDFARYFGPRMASRVVPPGVDSAGDPMHSKTIEDLYFNLDTRLKSKKPFIYLCDSMDALSSNYEGKKFDEKKTEWSGGKKAKGDYGDGKAKINSTNLRRIMPQLRDTGSILIIISQLRDNIDAGPFDPDKVVAGGHALRFYAHAQLWMSPGRKITKKVNNTDRTLGFTARVAIKKNRITGKEWTVTYPIMRSCGIDDMGGCVDFLVEEKRWKKDDNGRIDGSGDIVGLKGHREQIIRKIESEDMEDDVRDIVKETWDAIERATHVERKQRYQ